MLKESQSENLVKHYGSLRNIASATEDELKAIGLSKIQITRFKAAIELGKRYAASAPQYSFIRSPRDVADLLMPSMRLLDREEFRALFLNTKNGIIHQETISIGTLNATLIGPRELFKLGIRRSAASVIVIHNHPSGDPEPSNEDVVLTRRLKDAGELLGIPVIDHVLLGDGRWVSFKERGLL